MIGTLGELHVALRRLEDLKRKRDQFRGYFEMTPEMKKNLEHIEQQIRVLEQQSIGVRLGGAE